MSVEKISVKTFNRQVILISLYFIGVTFRVTFIRPHSQRLSKPHGLRTLKIQWNICIHVLPDFRKNQVFSEKSLQALTVWINIKNTT